MRKMFHVKQKVWISAEVLHGGHWKTMNCDNFPIIPIIMFHVKQNIRKSSLLALEDFVLRAFARVFRTLRGTV